MPVPDDIERVEHRDRTYTMRRAPNPEPGASASAAPDPVVTDPTASDTTAGTPAPASGSTTPPIERSAAVPYEEWAISNMDGLDTGRLCLMVEKGEDGAPVYWTFRPGEHEYYMEGSAWPDLVRALINEVDPPPVSATPLRP